MSLNLNIEEFEATTPSNSLNQNESLPLESEGLVVSKRNKVDWVYLGKILN